MKFLTGMAEAADGAKAKVMVSQQCTLLKFPDGSFAVQDNHFAACPGPYLQFDLASKSLAVSIDGHGVTMGGTIQARIAAGDARVANYRMFRKADLSLPDTCIECAEHALKCMHENRHYAERIDDDTGACVSMSIPSGNSHDIDVEDMNEKAFEAFPHGLVTAVDATLAGLEPGDGLALVYSKDPKKRKKNDWTVHAMAILLKSTNRWDRFMMVCETFAPDTGGDVEMTSKWKLSCYLDAQDFKDCYRGVMPPDKYSLWKLSTSPRG